MSDTNSNDSGDFGAMAKGNIFQNPLASSKAILQKRIDINRKKNLKRGYFYLILSFFMLTAYSFSFLYEQIGTFFGSTSTLASIQSEIDEYDKTTLPELRSQKNLHEADYSKQSASLERALDQVFPKDTDKLGIIKRLENFATETNAQYPPFELNSISIGQPEKKGQYTILPISTSIRCSTANFERFLRLINLSGYLKSTIPIRLMTISNINISYRGIDPSTGKDQGVNFNVKIDAYSRS